MIWDAVSSRVMFTSAETVWRENTSKMSSRHSTARLGRAAACHWGGRDMLAGCHEGGRGLMKGLREELKTPFVKQIL